jgi:hypothetical protein
LFTKILDENGNSHEIKNKAKFQFRSSGVTISPIEIMERLQSGSKFKQADMPISYWDSRLNSISFLSNVLFIVRVNFIWFIHQIDAGLKLYNGNHTTFPQL